MSKPTLEEQIDALYERGWNDCRQEKDYDPRKSIEWQTVNASLRELQSIRSAELPVEPEHIRDKRSLVELHGLGGSDALTIKYIDDLKSALQVAQQERDIDAANGKHWAEAYRKWATTDATRNAYLAATERAEKAESELAALRLEFAQLNGDIPYGN